eukprot:5465_1
MGTGCCRPSNEGRRYNTYDSQRRKRGNKIHPLLNEDYEEGKNEFQKKRVRAEFEIDYKSATRVEIYFILLHGLGGDIKSSWTNKQNHITYSELLAKKYPHSKIISYGYPTSFNEGFENIVSLKERGELFVKALTSYIKDHKTKPIIFIAHSMGGLVVKHGLIYSSQRQTYSASNIVANRLYNIYKRTIGIIFYGTPHLGSQIASLYSKFKLLPYFGPSNDIKQLRTDNCVLIDLKKEFRGIVEKHPRHKHIKIMSFIELHGTAIPSKRIVHETSSSCDLSEEIETLMKLEYNHVEMCKPANENDQRFVHSACFIDDLLDKHVIKCEIQHTVYTDIVIIGEPSLCRMKRNCKTFVSHPCDEMRDVCC